MYLMTSPHATMTGVYHCPALYMAHETGLSIEGATKALARLIHEGYCHYDEASEYVFVLRMAAHQIGESLHAKDKRVDGLKKDVEKMQEPFKSRFLSIYGILYHLISPTQNTSPSEAPSKPPASQDQDQDQDQDQKSEVPQVAASTTRRANAIRIPEDFSLTDERRLVAEAERLPAERTFEKFRDYWSAASGAKARKLDWDATWRNWCKSEADRSPARKLNGSYGETPEQRKLRIYGNAQ